MEHISTSQLAKYETILAKIDEEYKKNEQLKKEVENEINKLMVVRVALEEDFTRENVFRVLVKVFRSIFDLFYMYNEQIDKSEFESLKGMENCKFYLVEICISKLFGAKIFTQKWLLNLIIKNSKTCVSKNVIINKGGRDRIFAIVPFDESTEPSRVTCKLFMSLGNIWNIIRISEVNVDLSYHLNLPENVVAKNSLFNSAVLPQIEYSFKCACKTKHFFETVVKNCYHNLNSSVFTVFSSSDANEVALKFTVDDDTCNSTRITLKKLENRLNLVSNSSDLHALKKYITKEMRCQNFVMDKMWFVALKNLKNYFQMELGQDEWNVENFKILHEEFRKLMFELVI